MPSRSVGSAGGRRGKAETLLSASTCPELCLVFDTRWKTVSSLSPPHRLSLKKSLGEQVGVITLISNQKKRL